jgi:6-phosphogluconate dehydrogenase
MPSARMHAHALIPLCLSKTQGQNFALNMASKGFSVSVCNRSHDKVDTTVQRAVAEGNLPLKGYKDVRFGVEGRKLLKVVTPGAGLCA